jgi:hypothetical protein
MTFAFPPLRNPSDGAARRQVLRPDRRDALRDFMGDVLLGKDPEAMDEQIARVILHVAHSSAGEPATTNPQFDRVGFVRAATHVGTR